MSTSVYYGLDILHPWICNRRGMSEAVENYKELNIRCLAFSRSTTDSGKWTV